MWPSLVIATRSPTARSLAAVSRYCSVPSSMRMPTRLLAFGTVDPAAALGGRSMIESMRPVPARSGAAAVGATTTAPVPACGTTTAAGGVIGAFALEYGVHLALAPDRRAYVLNAWRIVDALIILAPLVSLLAFAPDALRSSPALRVLRLARVLLFGARARHGLVAGADMGIARAAPSGPPRVTELAPERKPRPLVLT